MIRTNSRCTQILLVDDSAADRRMIELAIVEAGVPAETAAVCDGEEALAFLRREEGYGEARRPDLILLDVNMPRFDGKKCLKAIKSSRSLCFIPVIMISTSSASVDILVTYAPCANSYLVKPSG